MAEPLQASDFPAFYRHVHGVDPFPWQADLVGRVLADGRWPDLVDVPTGLGKTSTIDVAIFVAAATADRRGADGPGRRRCFLVVDRRLVVDEAHTHARQLSEAVARAEGSGDVAGRVAAGLRAYAPTATGDLLPVTRMRGGTTWDAAWLDRPDRPGIVLGTVDQIGSRLLFRGYGVGDRRRPLDAALVGTDSLVLVDEAHLATALITTVDAALARDTSPLPVPSPGIVRLSATAVPSERTYRFDEEAHRDHPEAWRRLTAGKQLVLRTATMKSCVRVLAEIVVEHLDAPEFREPADAPVGLVVCNTVDRARAVHAAVVEARPELDCELLIGRSRPLDRADVQRRVVGRFGVGRAPASTPAVLVATQTVEVGVNLDVDVLVTESTSWDALVQRLGRLNRLGRLGSARFPGVRAAPAVVVHDGQADGPIYGAARDRTWAALGSLDAGAGSDAGSGIDVSPLRCRDLSATTMADPRCSLRPADVPVLLAPVLDAWAQTGPVPLNDPPVAPYLHGFESGTAPVQVLWRDGLLETCHSSEPAALVELDGEDVERAAPQLEMLLAQWPPRAEETVEIPFGAARRWLAGEAVGAVGDLDGLPDEPSSARRATQAFRVLAQRAAIDEDSHTAESTLRWSWIDASALRPGDRVVVPCQRGGHDRYGWAPSDERAVPDLREAVAFAPSRSRRDPALGLDAGLLGRLEVDPDLALGRDLAALADLSRSVAGDDPDMPSADAVASALATGLPDSPPERRGWTDESWNALRDWLAASGRRVVDVSDPVDAWFPGTEPRPWLRLLTGPRPGPGGARSGAEGDDDEVAASSVGSQQVALAVHHDAVGVRAAQIAMALGLPDDLRAVCADAARWHDLGKVDGRFQLMLHGGDPIDAVLAPEPLAKSGMDATDRGAWRRAARLSGLPPGARHEAWSAALVEEHLAHHTHPGDTDLLVHLVASHHGYARPWSRLVTDAAPRDLEAVIDGHKTTVTSARTVSLDHPGRFARLNRRYGRWCLALLEAVVRCADTTVSAEGS